MPSNSVNLFYTFYWEILTNRTRFINIKMHIDMSSCRPPRNISQWSPILRVFWYTPNVVWDFYLFYIHININNYLFTNSNYNNENVLFSIFIFLSIIDSNWNIDHLIRCSRWVAARKPPQNLGFPGDNGMVEYPHVLGQSRRRVFMRWGLCDQFRVCLYVGVIRDY